MTEDRFGIRESAIDVLRSGRAELEMVIALGELIAADARFNLGFLRTEKHADDESRVLFLIDMYEECVVSIVHEAGLVASGGDLSELARVVNTVTERLRSATGAS